MNSRFGLNPQKVCEMKRLGAVLTGVKMAIYEDLETTKPSANQHGDNEGGAASERPIYCLLGCMDTFNASHKRKQSSSLSPALRKETLSPASFFRIFSSNSLNFYKTERVSTDAQYYRRNRREGDYLCIVGHVISWPCGLEGLGDASHRSQELTLLAQDDMRDEPEKKKRHAQNNEWSASKNGVTRPQGNRTPA